MELHFIIDRDDCAPEQDGRQSIDTIVTNIISGQHDDVARVLCVKPPVRGWPHDSGCDDVTSAVAWAIADRCDGFRHWIPYNSRAYQLVEQYVGIERARACLDQEAAA